MTKNIEIREVRCLDPGLGNLFSALLTATVNDGASIGFLAPMDHRAAAGYWRSVLAPGTVLLSAWAGGKLTGSVQLHLCLKENGLHRAEICKLMVHPLFRRRGVARQLMEAAHGYARKNGRHLLVLDTREGDPSNDLYRSLGYTSAGKIPGYARSSDGRLETTVLYFLQLD